MRKLAGALVLICLMVLGGCVNIAPLVVTVTQSIPVTARPDTVTRTVTEYAPAQTIAKSSIFTITTTAPPITVTITSTRYDARAMELLVVQTAVLEYKNDHNGVIAASTGVTGNGGVLAPYLDTSLSGTYSWDAKGIVTQIYYP